MTFTYRKYRRLKSTKKEKKKKKICTQRLKIRNLLKSNREIEETLEKEKHDTYISGNGRFAIAAFDRGNGRWRDGR